MFKKDSEHNLGFILSEKGKNSPSDWNECELNFLGKHRLPYIDSIERKMINTEILALIKSNVSTCSRVPQACRRNAVFVVSTEYMKDLNDVKRDLNESFQKSLESKWKTVEFESGQSVSVTVISNKKQQLTENQILMKVNRSENKQSLVRNIVYFLNKYNQVINSKVILQYYVNRKVCGNIENIEFSVSSHGKSKDKKPFYAI